MLKQKMRNHFLATLAKRYVQQLAINYKTPGLCVSRDEAVTASAEDLEKTYQLIRLAGDALHRAFETRDEYERDWFLFWARRVNADANAPLNMGGIPGVITMDRDSVFDRNVAYVQRYLANKMAVCARKMCKRPYFRTRKGQKYCSKHCSHLVNLVGKLRYYHEVGREQRRKRAKSG